jgi:hypothetical protein
MPLGGFPFSAWQPLQVMQVCLYFFNNAYDRYESWSFMHQPAILQRAKRWPQHYPSLAFPYMSVGVLLPCALLVALGVRVVFFASILCSWEVLDSLTLVWNQVSEMAAAFKAAVEGYLIIQRVISYSPSPMPLLCRS